MQGNDFVQSQMYKRGVACWSCHDVHGTENNALLLKPVESLCTTCHTPQSLPGPNEPMLEHSHHSVGNVQCVDCHMPKIAREIARRLRAQPHVPLHSAVGHGALQDPEPVHDVPSRPDDRERDGDDLEMARRVAVASAAVIAGERCARNDAVRGSCVLSRKE